MSKSTAPQEVRDIILKIMGELSSERPKAGDVHITEVVDKIFDAKEKKHLKISGLKDGTLFINVDSPAQTFQFNLKRTNILKLIQKQIPGIQKIYFKTGKVV